VVDAINAARFLVVESAKTLVPAKWLPSLTSNEIPVLCHVIRLGIESPFIYLSLLCKGHALFWNTDQV
jgi:hypothetical protein